MIIKHQIQLYEESGIDITGYKKIELEFLLRRASEAKKFSRRFYHPAEGNWAEFGFDPKKKNWVRIRSESLITIKDIQRKIDFYQSAGKEFRVVFSQWRIVDEA
jgi:hypothetical protein